MNFGFLKSRQKIYILGIIIALVLLVGIFVITINQPGDFRFTIEKDVTFPGLTGPYPVGKAIYPVVDSARMDETPTSSQPRVWTIRIFYPAQPALDAVPGPYVREPLRSALAQVRIKDGDAGMFDLIHANAYFDAPVAPNDSGYPVLLFSPGGGEQPLFYTSLLEQVASYGYIVVSIPEPRDTPVIVFPNGEIITPIKMNFKDTLTCMIQDEFCRRAMLGDKETMQELWDMMRDVRPQDLITTLDYLEWLNRDDALLAGQLDLSRVGVFGHSYGGATAARMGTLDTRFDAAVVLDSDIFLVVPDDADSITIPVMYLGTGGVELDIFGRKAVREITEKSLAYLGQSPSFYGFQIAGTAHQNIQTDWALLAPYIENFQAAEVIQDINGERALQIIVQYTVAFFDRHLRDMEAPLLDDLSPDYPEISTCCEY